LVHSKADSVVHTQTLMVKRKRRVRLFSSFWLPWDDLRAAKADSENSFMLPAYRSLSP